MAIFQGLFLPDPGKNRVLEATLFEFFGLVVIDDRNICLTLGWNHEWRCQCQCFVTAEGELCGTI